MGVPKFYRWVSERYPCLSQVVKEHQVSGCGLRFPVLEREAERLPSLRTGAMILFFPREGPLV